MRRLILNETSDVWKNGKSVTNLMLCVLRWLPGIIYSSLYGYPIEAVKETHALTTARKHVLEAELFSVKIP